MKAFISFGAGGQNYIDACNRIKGQVELLDIFDIIKIYTEEDLKADTEFWLKHSEFIKANKRGYGYWLWKSYIIKKTMDLMGPGTILFYADCGCEIDSRKQNEMNELFSVVKKDLIFGSLVNAMFKEKQFNKMDLLLKLDMLNDNCLNSRQRQSGAIMCYLCDKVRNLINEWIDLSLDYSNSDDSPSINPNFDCFIEHRHDQSLFSLLTKKYDIYSNHEIDYYNSCIKYERNRSGISKI
jgi:hypothetical protein